MEDRNFNFIIKYDELIGKGGLGNVYTAYNINDDEPMNTKYAAKELPEQFQDEEKLLYITNEIFSSLDFENPNLVRF